MYKTRETRMCTPNSTYNNFIKENMNYEYTLNNINGEKQEWAHLTISLKKTKIIITPLKI